MKEPPSTWRFPEARLLVFAKAPIPGEVKTRLLPALNARQSAALQARLIRHTLVMATQVALCPVELWCSPTCAHPFFIRCASSFGLSLYPQQGADLGKRMASASAAALAHCPYVVLIGCDCPGLDGEDLGEALAALREGYDAVVGPAEDGGYVLLGLRRPAPALFVGMAWGSGRVLMDTRTRLRALGWRWHELKTHWDVDRPEDLERLQRSKHLFPLPLRERARVRGV